MPQRLTIVLVAATSLATIGCQPAPQALDPVLGALMDRQAIDQLIAGDYPHALDTRNFQAYAELYTEDGELTLAGDSVKGRAAIKEFVAALPAEPRVIHPITNLSYTVDGDTATGGAYWQDIGLVGNAPGVVIAGRYEDTLRKVNGVWRIAKRSIVIEFAAAPAAATQ